MSEITFSVGVGMLGAALKEKKKGDGGIYF
jgi:hypothetical protein